MQRLPARQPGIGIECVRCHETLVRPVMTGLEAPLAFAAAALLLLPPATMAPLMSVISFGIQRRNWLPTGVEALWSEHFGVLAGLIFLFSIAIPYLYLGLLVWVLGGVRLGVRKPLGPLFRWSVKLRPWAMIEVYLVGCCVAYTRLEDVGSVHIDVGGWCLLAATIAALMTGITLDERSVWSALSFVKPPQGSGALVACDACDLLIPETGLGGACPRCGAPLRRRKPDSLRRTLALVIAGFVLYLPANVLPVLSIERFGHDQPNTILGGVDELVTAGLWPLAIIVFSASILVPLLKLFGLSLMLALTHRRSRRWLVGRAVLYRFIDFVGRWSSIDLFMISILVALVQFGSLTRVRPEGGAVAFAAVVVVTMFASASFDPRIMWDRAVAHG